MNQKIAQAIIKSAHGENAVAIGHCNCAIFWIYSNEDEMDYKVHDVDWLEYVDALDKEEQIR